MIVAELGSDWQTVSQTYPMVVAELGSDCQTAESHIWGQTDVVISALFSFVIESSFQLILLMIYLAICF